MAHLLVRQVATLTQDRSSPRYTGMAFLLKSAVMLVKIVMRGMAWLQKRYAIRPDYPAPKAGTKLKRKRRDY